MSTTVRNESRPGIYFKLSTVKRWIEQCACEWVIEGRSFRELSPQERLCRMLENLERCGSMTDTRPQSRRETYLPPINVCGERELMPKSAIWTQSVKYQCLRDAREIAQNY